MRGKLVVIACVVVALTLTLTGAGFWEKKPYTQWSEKDARKMLEKSPWCYEFNWGRQSPIGQDVTGPPIGTLPDPTSTPADGSRGVSDSEREFVTIVRVMLFSARPVRQAYATLIAKGDKARLEKLKDFAERDFGDEIVIAWVIDSKPKGATSVFDLDRELRALAVGELQNDTYIASSSGKKLFIKDFIPPTADGTGAKFIFPRTMPDGTPFLTAADKSFRFQTRKFKMKDDLVAVDATFKVEDLQLGGQLEF
jgi:hypothetical protein